MGIGIGRRQHRDPSPGGIEHGESRIRGVVVEPVRERHEPQPPVIRHVPHRFQEGYIGRQPHECVEALPGIQPRIRTALPMAVHSSDVRSREQFVEHIVGCRHAGERAPPAAALTRQTAQGQFLDERDAEVVGAERARQCEEPCLGLTGPAAGRERSGGRVRPTVVPGVPGPAACDGAAVGRGGLRETRPQLLRGLDRPQPPDTNGEPVLDVQPRPWQASQRMPQPTQLLGIRLQRAATCPRADQRQLSEKTGP